MNGPLRLDGETLTPGQLELAAFGAPVAVHPDARQRVAANADAYLAQPDGDVLRRKWTWLTDAAPPDDAAALARQFVLGHCAGVGPPLAPEVVRATVLARANALLSGVSAVRPALIDRLLAMVEAGITPVVPRDGDVGAAGSPQLAHIARVALGFGGLAWVPGASEPVDSRPHVAALPPFEPTHKEVLSLLNGPTHAVALGALVVAQADRVMEVAERACAMSFEVVRADLHCLRTSVLRHLHQPHAVEVANRLWTHLEGSSLCAIGRDPDPFSIRCAPVVLGAVFEALDHASDVLTRALNAAADNPLFVDGQLIEAGTLHAAPVSLALDHLGTALTTAASIAERRVFRMTYGQLSGLPSFLVRETGLNSGLMLAQYTAASRVSEAKTRLHPASLDSLPTIQHREDHLPMAATAAWGAHTAVEVLADVVAIELMCGAQGLDVHLGVGEPAEGTAALRDGVRQHVARWTVDRVLHPDLEALGRWVRAGAPYGG